MRSLPGPQREDFELLTCSEVFSRLEAPHDLPREACMPRVAFKLSNRICNFVDNIDFILNRSCIFLTSVLSELEGLLMQEEIGS